MPYHKGQDVDSETRYTSLNRATYVNQTEIQQRTAANIVGVNPKPPNYREPTGEGVTQTIPEVREGGEELDALDLETQKYCK